ncbi:hypothetical protein SJI19_16870 [Acerihabitans sp. TG2]|uniref:hypothetical protein n=1 Tax=Acerihabitans sp. TG2 TaxID=3096008 RepID=UPI002B235DD5|nr:hypothetical protein [Acerihabitans sp. TG2]MEA9392199.1 hypothetical protein [Acerihabitans sp. TG2]
MSYSDDLNDDFDIPVFTPKENEIEVNSARPLSTPEINIEEVLKEKDIPIYDGSGEANLSVGGLKKNESDEWEVVDELEAAQEYGIFQKEQLVYQNVSIVHVIAHFSNIANNAEFENFNQNFSLSSDKVSPLFLESGETITITNQLKDKIERDSSDFNKADSVNEHFEEVKLSDKNAHVRTETLRDLANEADDPQTVYKNQGQSFPPGSRTLHFENVDVDPMDGGEPHQRFTLGGSGGAPAPQGTYRKNMADVRNGVDHLAGGIASLIGGGAALTGVLANRAGTFMKSVSSGLQNQTPSHPKADSPEAEATQPIADVEGNKSERDFSESDSPIIYSLPSPSKSPDNFLFGQMEARRDAYRESIDTFWAHEKVKPIKSQIEALARENGISVTEMNQKISHDPEYAYIRETIQNAVENDTELKDTLKTADNNLDEWIETYQVLKDKQQRVVDHDASEHIDSELEKQREQMEEVVADAPPGEDMFSKLEEFKMRIKEIVEKIREAISRFTSSKGQESENAPSP